MHPQTPCSLASSSCQVWLVAGKVWPLLPETKTHRCHDAAKQQPAAENRWDEALHPPQADHPDLQRQGRQLLQHLPWRPALTEETPSIPAPSTHRLVHVRQAEPSLPAMLSDLWI